MLIGAIAYKKLLEREWNALTGQGFVDYTAECMFVEKNV